MDKRPDANTHGAERGLTRFEGFSDAVFAIALTLLIVEIKVPGSPQGPQVYGDLVKAMAEQWREHLALILCYLVIGAYWLQHHYSGRIYAKSDHFAITTALAAVPPAAADSGAPKDGKGVRFHQVPQRLHTDEAGVRFPPLADGSIVITASIAKEKGMPASALYSATKGAVRSLVRGFARELAPRRIRVNSVSPGPIETAFFDRLGIPTETVQQYLVHSNPLGRMGRPEEAAAVALFLLSDEASYVTGSDYFVDGGEAQL